MAASHRKPLLDRTPSLLREGYGWLPDRMRRAATGTVRGRLLGKPMAALRGPEAVRFFYDERHVLRTGAVPGPVLSTLFGRGAVHTLDGDQHKVRKAMFMSLLTAPDGVAGLVERACAEWDTASTAWEGLPEIVLFDESAAILTRAVCRWAGVPLDQRRRDTLAGDLVAMVDGFATLGPRHWRARRARGRCEAWLADLVDEVRAERVETAKGSVLDTVAWHREVDGRLLDPRTAAVEVLNVLRPTVAVAWFVTFAAHALQRWPGNRARLRAGDAAFATAFAHEVRRFYPFAPFTGGVAAAELSWQGETIPAGSMVLLDLYGQNHDPALWGIPYAFRPDRFLDKNPKRDELVPQGGGDASTGHRCPGEAVTIALLESLSVRLARLEYDIPFQDLTIPLRRIPTRPRSGFRMAITSSPDRDEAAVPRV